MSSQEGAPKKGHKANMTKSTQAAVYLDSWFLILGSVIGTRSEGYQRQLMVKLSLRR
jgi:hypothetical protein